MHYWVNVCVKGSLACVCKTDFLCISALTRACHLQICSCAHLRGESRTDSCLRERGLRESGFNRFLLNDLFMVLSTNAEVFLSLPHALFPSLYFCILSSPLFPLAARPQNNLHRYKRGLWIIQCWIVWQHNATSEAASPRLCRAVRVEFRKDVRACQLWPVSLFWCICLRMQCAWTFVGTFID